VQVPLGHEAFFRKHFHTDFGQPGLLVMACHEVATSQTCRLNRLVKSGRPLTPANVDEVLRPSPDETLYQWKLQFHGRYVGMVTYAPGFGALGRPYVVAKVPSRTEFATLQEAALHTLRIRGLLAAEMRVDVEEQEPSF
jgi:hypothetical protein